MILLACLYFIGGVFTLHLVDKYILKDDDITLGDFLGFGAVMLMWPAALIMLMIDQADKVVIVRRKK